ncbi:MAG: hypothetical protein A3J79_14595 [Elusimicrobia bacterium RIFOXYB2_FULL_62_6]|nr:MAG: hypothetical protein A3J79_14595 [Elusimicrobia bacterium RIFOXYB2_FULL_62_6]
MLKGLRRLRRSLASGRPGQATTEVVLLFPLFVIIVLITSKTFALLVLVQKMEIASYYAARRWQLESHLNSEHAAWDAGLKDDIEEKVSDYLGYGKSSGNFLSLKGSGANLAIMRTQVWNVLTLEVETGAVGGDLKRLICPPGGSGSVCGGSSNCDNGYNYICSGNKKLTVVKYVPNRDRPIQFKLPGIHE